MTSKIPDYLLEQYCLQELSPQRMAEIREQLKKDPAAQQRVANLAASNDSILKTYPAKPMAAAIQRRAEQKRVTARGVQWKILVPAFSILGLSLILLNLPQFQEHPVARDTIRLKGAEAQLFIYRKTGAQVELLNNRSLAHPGDLLQIAYVSNQKPYGMIFSIDGRKKVTLHFPIEGTPSATPMQLKQKSPLPAAYELDDAPDFERFFFLTAGQPFDTPTILKTAQALAQDKALAALAPFPVDKNITQVTVLLLKGGN